MSLLSVGGPRGRLRRTPNSLVAGLDSGTDKLLDLSDNGVDLQSQHRKAMVRDLWVEVRKPSHGGGLSVGPFTPHCPDRLARHGT